MDERDFDKKLADKLKNIDDFDYDESNWNALNTRLDGTNRYRFSALHTAVILLLALLSTNGWMGYQWHTTQIKLQEVNHILDSLHFQGKPAVNHINITDTIYKKVIVHQIDTIFHTVISQPDNRAIADADNHPEKPEVIVKNARTNGAQNETSQRQLDPSNQIITNKDLYLKDSMPPAATIADSLQKSKKEIISDSLTVEQPDAKKQEMINASKKEREKAFLTHPFYLGIAAQVPFISHPATFNSGGMGGGLRGMYSFNEHLRVTLQVNYVNVRYNVNNFEESLGIIDINNGSSYQNDELLSVESKQHYVQGALGFSYIFGSTQKLRPYVSLSYLVETSLSRHLAYQYRDITTDKIYLRQAEDNGGNTAWHILEAALGVEYKLGYHSLLHLEWYFNKKTGQQFLVRPDQLGVRAVLYYHLK